MLLGVLEEVGAVLVGLLLKDVHDALVRGVRGCLRENGDSGSDLSSEGTRSI
jgi:hypothetical protein